MSSALDSLEEREEPEAAVTVLVTSIRLLQIPHRVAEERADH